MQIRDSTQAFNVISKDTFYKFKKVRRLNTPLMGEHFLYSRDGVKYILKQLPASTQFSTTRPSVLRLHKYPNPIEPHTSYLYPIFGSSLESAIRSSLSVVKNCKTQKQSEAKFESEQSIELKEYEKWVSRHGGSEEKALLELLRFLVWGLIRHQSLEVHKECIRVANGEVVYCYDSWMRNNEQILKEEFQQLQSLFISERGLRNIADSCPCSGGGDGRGTDDCLGVTFSGIDFRNQPVTYDSDSPEKSNARVWDALFTACLSVLTLASQELNVRNYKCGVLELNHENIAERIRYFRLRNTKTKLGAVLETVLATESSASENLGASVLETLGLGGGYSSKKTKVRMTNLMGSKIQKKQQRQFISSSKNTHHNEDSVLKELKMNSRLGTGVSEIYSQAGKAKQTAQFDQIKPFCQKSDFKNKENPTYHLSEELQTRSNEMSKLNSQPKDVLELKNKIKAPERIKAVSKEAPRSVEKSSKKTVSWEGNKYEGSGELKPKLCSEPSFPNGLNIKQTVRSADHLPDSNLEILTYLGLRNHLPKSAYERNILEHLEGTVLKTGFQKIIYENNSIYFGEVCYMNANGVQGDSREGIGLYIFPSDDIYYGEWKNNQIDGFGKYIFRTGEVYAGSSREGRKHGYGQFKYEDGKSFEGYWANDIKLGFGIVHFPNGVRFIGNFGPEDDQTEGVFSGTEVKTGEVWTRNDFLQDYDYNRNFLSGHQKAPSDIKSFNSAARKLNFPEWQKHQKSDVQYRDQHAVFEGQFQKGEIFGEGVLRYGTEFKIRGSWASGMLISYSP